MKTAINHNAIKNALLVTITILGCFVNAQVLDPFTPRLNENLKGDYTMIANNMLSRTATQSYNGTSGNHNFSDNVYVDIDGLFDANNDNIDDTFNSSSANYSNPQPQLECLTTYKAYLYWAAADREPTTDPNSENQPNWNYNDVMLMLPGQTQYTTLTADDVIYRGRDFHLDNDPYICFKDITTLVQNASSPYGRYQVANVEAKLGSVTGHGGGNIGTSGGWQIVFVYESPELPTKNISLFDGYANVTSSVNNFDIVFSGFQTVPTGDVNANVLIGSLEGDRDLSGDQLQIQNTAGNFVAITAPQRSSNNFFNSRITIGNSDFLDRNPASQNTLGFDAAVFNLNNTGNTLITNNQTSATLRLTSNQETYGLYLVGLCVDVWSPNLAPIDIVLESGASPTAAGNTLGLSFDLQNSGNDDALNLTISSILPPQIAGINATTLPSGVTFAFNSTTNEVVFTFADGMLDVGESLSNVEFDIILQDECYFLQTDCDLDFDLQFTATYTGNQNPNVQTTLSSASIKDCNQGDLLPLEIEVIQPTVNWATAPGALDVFVDCDDPDALNNAQNMQPETDVCNFTLTKTSGAFSAEPQCPSNGAYTNTWTFTDACGVTIQEYVQNIFVQDTTAPILNVPNDVSVECGDSTDPADTGEATATDTCGSVTITYEDTSLPGCGNTETITRTWTAKDNCGNEVSDTQTITVIDTTNPTLSVPSDVTLDCTQNNDTNPTATGLATGSDTCGNVSITYSDAVVSNCGNTQVITRTWTATDDCNNTTSETQTISIVDNDAPIINVPDAVEIECTDSTDPSNTGTATGTDACGNVDISYADNVVAACGNTQTITRTWTATDDCGNASNATQIITVIDDSAPDLSSCTIENTTIECTADNNEAEAIAWNNANILALEACATDNCDTDFSGQVTSNFDFDNLNSSCGPCGSITVTYTVKDDCDNEATVTVTLTFDDQTNPDLSNCSVTDQSIECSGEDNEQLASDWNAANIAALESCADDLGITVTSNYAYANLVPTCGQGGTIAVTYTITDDCGNAVTLDAELTLEDTTPPNLDNCSVTDQTFECSGENNELIASNWNAANIAALENCVSDSCDPNFTSQVSSSYSYSNLDPTCGQGGTITVVYTVTDDCDNRTTLTATLTLEDTTPPNLDNCAVTDQTIECSGTDNEQLANDWNAANIAALEDCETDACDNATFSAPNTSLFARSNAQVTSNFLYSNLVSTCGQGGTITVTYTVTDSCDNEATVTATLTLEDSSAPDLSNCTVENTVLECTDTENESLADAWNAANIAALENCATDSCDTDFTGQVTSNYDFNNLNTTCGPCGTLNVTYTITDDCGNDTTLTATLTFDDGTIPDLSNCEVNDQTIECSGSNNEQVANDWNAANILALENCADDLGITVTSDYNFGNLSSTCGLGGTITVVYTITDDCGNATTLNATLTLEDTTAPTFTVPGDITIECDQDPNDLVLTGDVIDEFDSCSETLLEATFSDAVVSGSCANESVITRTWSLTDDCNNTTTLVQTITVIDSTAPTFTVPNSVTIECDHDANNLDLTGDVIDEADNCSSDLEATYTDAVTNGSCANESVITRTWSLTDDCDNTTTLVQTITVIDSTTPTFTVPNSVTIECDQDPNDLDLTGDVIDEADNCSSDLEATYTDAVTNGSCANESVITRTWSLTDDCDNTTTLVQTITVIDSTAPTFTVPNSVTIECDQDPNDLDLTGDVIDEADNCSSDLEATYTDAVSTGSCANESVITRTWSLTDDCDNTTTLVQTITVIDSTAPTFTVPNSVTIECDQDPNDLDLTGDVIDEADNCSSDLEATYSDVVTAGSCANESVITRTWTLRDDCDNITTLVQTITIEDNSDPVLTVPADITVECTDSTDVSVTGLATATDSCGNTTVTFEDTSVEACGNTITITRTWTATDDCGNSVSEAQIISVVDTTNPILTVPEDATVECTESTATSATGMATATDSCGNVTIDFTDSSTPGCGNTETITRTWTATDECGNSVTETQTITVVDTIAPDISSCTVENTILECSDTENETLADAWNAANIAALEACATDACDTDFTGQVTSNYDFNNLNTTCGPCGTLNVSYTITDDCGNATTLIVTLTFDDGTIPDLSNCSVTDQSIECSGDNNEQLANDWNTANITALENCADDLGITVSSNYEFTNLISTCGQGGTIPVVYTITDDCGNATTLSATLTLEDTTPPNLDNCSVSDQSIECSGENNEQLANDWNAANIAALEDCVADACDPDFSGQITSDYTYTNLVSTCGQGGTITVVYIITDDCGNEVTLNATLTLEDTTPPNLDNCSVTDQTIECSGEDNEQLANDWNAANIAALEVCGTDSCDTDFSGQVTSNYSYTNLVSTCGQGGTITVVYTIIDDCGNEVTLNATLTLEDTTPPNLDNCSVTDQTIECSGEANEQLANDWNAANIAALEACGTDACDTNFTGQVTSDYAYSNLVTTCGLGGTITVNYIVTDDCGNETTLSATLTLEDTAAPDLSNCTVENTVLECTDTNNESLADAWNAANIAALEACAIDACDSDFTGQVTSDYNYENLNTICGPCGNISVTYTITDDCGNVTTLTATLTFDDGTIPDLSNCNIEDTTIECAGSFNATLASDWNDNNIVTLQNCADDIAVTVTSDFDYANLESTCGLAGTLDVVYTITDDCGNATTLEATLIIQDTVAPTFTVPETITIECDQDINDLNLTGDVTDEFDNCSVDALEATFIDEEPVPGECVNQFTVNRVWTVSDDCGNATTFIQTITVQDTTAPTFTVPESVTLECDQDITDLNLTGDVIDEADNCSTNLEATFQDGEPIPGECPNLFSIIRTWTLTDDCNNTTTLTQTITVQDTTAPSFSVPESVTIECNQDPNDLDITGDVTDEADNCSTNLEATFVDAEPTTGECPAQYSFVRTWTLVDDCGNTTELTQTITVEDTTAPTFTVPENVTLECDQDVTDLDLTGDVTDEADNCSSDLEATFVDAEPTAGECPAQYSFVRTWTLVDDCGNTTELTQTITVEDTTAPTFTVPENVTLECDQDVTDLNLTGDVTDEADNCSTVLEATFVDGEPTTGECPTLFSFVRTWTLIDDCGNTTELNQTISVQDTTAPTFTVPDSITLECDEDLTNLEFTGDVIDEADNCSTGLEATYVDSIANGSCANEFIMTRTWTLTDDCGNETVQTQTITVQDTTAPTFVEDLPSDTTAECDAIPDAVTLTAIDNCGSAEVTFEENEVPGSCPGESVITRTWTAVDECGLVTQHIQTITVQDTTAPALFGDFEETIDAICTDIPARPDLMFSDACSNITVTYNETTTNDGTAMDYIIFRDWTVTDECGNAQTYTQTVNVTVDSSNQIPSTDGSLCIAEDFDFDLFDLLVGDYNIDGVWTANSSDVTLDGSFFNPSSLLDFDGNYTEDQLGDYDFTYTYGGDCPGMVTVTITLDDECVVFPCGEDDVVISKAVTPLGSAGVNDTFTITGVEDCGFVYELQIFNRWGAKIYDNPNYQNDWRGEASSGSIGSSNYVPTGTYYYVLTLKNSGLRPFTGPIYVSTK